MSSLRRHEGYLLVDNSVSGGAREEGAILTCSHCQKQMRVNPLRTRARAYCAGCDHYICDWCDGMRVRAVVTCRTFNKILDDQQKAAFRAEQASRGAILVASA